MPHPLAAVTSTSSGASSSSSMAKKGLGHARGEQQQQPQARWSLTVLPASGPDDETQQQANVIKITEASTNVLPTPGVCRFVLKSGEQHGCAYLCFSAAAARQYRVYVDLSTDSDTEAVASEYVRAANMSYIPVPPNVALVVEKLASNHAATNNDTAAIGVASLPCTSPLSERQGTADVNGNHHAATFEHAFTIVVKCKLPKATSSSSSDHPPTSQPPGVARPWVQSCLKRAGASAASAGAYLPLDAVEAVYQRVVLTGDILVGSSSSSLAVPRDGMKLFYTVHSHRIAQGLRGSGLLTRVNDNDCPKNGSAGCISVETAATILWRCLTDAERALWELRAVTETASTSS
eukprot:PhM_4_TR3746/c0_g1_i1/m.19094